MARIVVGIHEAKTHLSRLIKRAEAGDEVIVKSFDKPVAKLVAYSGETADRMPGLLAGKIKVKPGFDDLPPGFELFGE